MNLSCNLAKHIFYCLGASPDCFGKLGVTANKTNRKIITEIDGAPYHGETCQHSVYAGKNIQDDIVLLVDIGDKDDPELIMVAKSSGVWLGIYYNNETSNFLVCPSADKEDWIGLSMAHKLSLASVIERQTQEGLVWEPIEVTDEMFDRLVKFTTRVTFESGQEGS